MFKVRLYMKNNQCLETSVSAVDLYELSADIFMTLQEKEKFVMIGKLCAVRPEEIAGFSCSVG